MLEPIDHPRPEQIVPQKAYFGGFARYTTPKETRQYMRGECGHMALALHRLMPGSQIWSVGGVHFAVEGTDGDFWDIRGRMSIDQLWSGLVGSTMAPMTRDELIDELNTGLYGQGFYCSTRERSARELMEMLAPDLFETVSTETSPARGALAP